MLKHAPCAVLPPPMSIHLPLLLLLQGLGTLLAGGALAAVPSLASSLGAVSQASAPRWLARAPGTRATPRSMPLSRLLMEGGTLPGPALSSARLPLRLLGARWCHHATFRGHGFPVYALIFDRTGERVITGADDARVKVRVSCYRCCCCCCCCCHACLLAVPSSTCPDPLLLLLILMPLLMLALPCCSNHPPTDANVLQKHLPKPKPNPKQLTGVVHAHWAAAGDWDGPWR